MSFLMFLILAWLVPAALILVAPQNWCRAVTGWVVLAVGLLLLDHHIFTVSPYDDDGAGFGDAIASALIGGWTIATIAAMLVRSRALLEGPASAEEKPWLQWLRCWSVPLAILFCCAGMHWVRNRLAGAEPVATIHFAILVPALAACLGQLWWKRRSLKNWTIYERAALAGLAAIAMLVVIDIGKGWRLWAEAERFAGAKPRCMMTYGGFEKRREAKSGWDLSPLVDRHYGTWAASKAPALVTHDQSGIHMYRWFVGRWQDVTHDRQPPCQPRLKPIVRWIKSMNKLQRHDEPASPAKG